NLGFGGVAAEEGRNVAPRRLQYCGAGRLVPRRHPDGNVDGGPARTEQNRTPQPSDVTPAGSTPRQSCRLPTGTRLPGCLLAPGSRSPRYMRAGSESNPVPSTPFQMDPRLL